MTFETVKIKTPELISELTMLWEHSVRTTHHFLEEEDIKRLRGYVPLAIMDIQTLIIAFVGDVPVGFAGLSSNKIEILFVGPDYMGKDIGRTLMTLAVKDFGARLIDVNEQNTIARAI